jgi:hypothetical protein
MSAPRSKNEDIKEASRFLRGTIADGLAEAITGAIAEDDAQLTKFHGTYLQDDRDLRPERRRKMLEQAYAFMARAGSEDRGAGEHPAWVQHRGDVAKYRGLLRGRTGQAVHHVHQPHRIEAWAVQL